MPENLQGIWEGKDRFLYFENATDDENPHFVIVLKEYYDWYYDRAAEPDNFAEKEARSLNSATHKNPEIIPFELKQIDQITDAYQLTVTYSKHYSNTRSFAIIDDKIYLNIYTKSEQLDDELNKDATLYRGYQHSDGFVLNSQPIDENISLLIMLEDKFYDVRYWQTDMDYEASSVTFKYQDDSFLVPKHLFAEGSNYSSVNGRSKNVRNTQAAFPIQNQSILYNQDKSVLILNEEPYLTKLTDKKSLDDLFEIIKEANSRRKPDPQPIFPVKLPKFPGEV